MVSGRPSLVEFLGMPFAVSDWARMPAAEMQGQAAMAYVRTHHCGSMRLRVIEYSPGYLSDHWCDKGHIVFCVHGEIEIELATGRTYRLTPGMSVQLPDRQEPHRTSSSLGAKLIVID